MMDDDASISLHLSGAQKLAVDVYLGYKLSIRTTLMEYQKSLPYVDRIFSVRAIDSSF